MLADINEEIEYIVVLTTSRLWRADMVKAIIQRDLRKIGADMKAVDRPDYSSLGNIWCQNEDRGMLQKSEKPA